MYLIFDRLWQLPMTIRIWSLLRLPRPHFIRDLAYKLQLLLHTLDVNQITFCMASKSALRADTTPLEGLLPALSLPLCHDIRCIVNTLLQLLLIFQLRKLARHNTKNDVLVLRQMGEWLEASGARRIVLEVVGVHVHLLEQLCRNAVVAAFAEVA